MKNTRKAPHENPKVQAIRAALIEGEKSGLSPRTPEDICAQVKTRNAERLVR